MAPIPPTSPVKRTPSDAGYSPDWTLPDYWYEIQYNGRKLKYTIDIIGNQPPKDPAGYPLYIAMHGGGTSDVNGVDDGGRGNDYEWNTMYTDWYKSPMANYYPDPPAGQTSTSNGAAVYVAIRGVSTGVNTPPGQVWTDDWNLHSRPEGQVLVERLIVHLLSPMPSEFNDHPRGPQYTQLVQRAQPRNFIDSNRVYLIGFSAGGNGAFELGTRLSDRFAAVVPAAGHPEGAALANLANALTILQVGEDDAYPYNYNQMSFQRAQVYLSLANKVLDNCQKDPQFGNRKGLYSHDCFVVKNTDRSQYTRQNGGVHNYWSRSPLIYATQQQILKKDRFQTWLDEYAKQGSPEQIQNMPDDAYKAEFVTPIPHIALARRNPTPPLVVWDLRGRTEAPTDRNDPNLVWEEQRYAYWLYLRRPMSSFDATYQPEWAWFDNATGNNSLHIERPNDYIAYLLAPGGGMLDLNAPIRVYIAGSASSPQTIQQPIVSKDIRTVTQQARGDTRWQFSSCIYLVRNGNDWIAKCAQNMAEVGPLSFSQ